MMHLITQVLDGIVVLTELLKLYGAFYTTLVIKGPEIKFLVRANNNANFHFWKNKKYFHTTFIFNKTAVFKKS